MKIWKITRIIMIGSALAVIGLADWMCWDSLARAAPIAGTSATQGQVQANGITIAYESFGPADRETVLLISGYGRQMMMWPDELCIELTGRGYRVIRFDNRDVGLSTHLDNLGRPDWQAMLDAYNESRPLPVAYTLDDMANDSIGLLSALGIEKAHIVGASMGGEIAQLIAINHPGRTLSHLYRF